MTNLKYPTSTPEYLNSLSPLDGRYIDKTQSLRNYFSEFALIHYRLKVEISWFISLAQQENIPEIPNLSPECLAYLEAIIDNFSLEDACEIKKIEQQTNHDVKAIEYFLKNKFLTYPDLANHINFIHFSCTSEDINNIAYAWMIKDALQNIVLPSANQLLNQITQLAKKHADIPMLARTHGQPATPTTVGKELINFSARLKSQIQVMATFKPLAKCNGAVGNYNAHVVTYPQVNWTQHCQTWIQSLDLPFNAYTTQIEPHDSIAELSHYFIRINNILIDYAKDIWNYISLGYFKQKIVQNEVGSSTMPHKVNPIDFENAEGNLGLANALFNYFANKLTQSRMQRDLSDSTVLRNLGTAFGHTLLAWQSLEKGNNKLEINRIALQHDLEKNWEILAEALQTMMRRYKIPNAYEQIKDLTRGAAIDAARFQRFIQESALPEDAKKQLQQLTPEKYIGLAAELVNQYE